MTTIEAPAIVAEDFRLAAFDLYRDVHKGIRAELFAVTGSAGTLDPSDAFGWIAFAEHVSAVEAVLAQHAHHEDTSIDPVLTEHFPDLAASVLAEHRVLERSFATIVDVAHRGASAAAGEQRRLAHLAYLTLSTFTSAYLAHQAVEETVITPLLEDAIGVEAMVGIHLGIIASMSPEELGHGLTLMLPAMNVDDRTEMLGGMQASAPAPAFDGIVSLTRSVLQPADFAAVSARLGLA